MLLLFLDVPLRVSFWLHRPALERLKDQCLGAPESVPKEIWVGIYRLQPEAHGKRGVLFKTMPGYLYGYRFEPRYSLNHYKEYDQVVPLGDGWYAIGWDP